MPFLPPIYESEPPLFKINRFRGVNNSVTATQVEFNETPEMLNMFLDVRGALNKRYGYERTFPTPLNGGAKINGMVVFTHESQYEEPLFACGDKLYRLGSKDVQPTVIYTGLANQPVNFFSMNGKLFIVDSLNYLQYDGITVSEVVPYVPTVMISTLPTTGVGEPFEDINLLGNGYKQLFSGDNTTKIYPLVLKNLDATTPIVFVDGVQTTAFTFDALNGMITFTNAPKTGTNNVEITVFKTFPGFPIRIKNCTFATTFGGTNDTRVFLSGNDNYPHQIWRSGLYQPNYFPENGFYQVGTQDSHVTGFEKQYNSLVVLKDNSTFSITYEIDPTTGEATFPIRPINSNVGAYAWKSIALVQNEPTFLDRSGVHSLNQSNLRDERNVRNISSKIENQLLFESNLQNAVAIDYENKYYLALNSRVYVYDYLIEEWFVYDNIVVDAFLEYKQSLYFGSNGLVYRFKDGKNDANPYNDDGQPIRAYWRSKILSFDTDEELKLIKRVFYSIMPSTNTSCELWYTTNKKNRRFFKKSRYTSFGYSTWDYSTFTYGAVLFPQESVNKIKAKKVIYFQLELRNEELNEALNILSIGIQYLVTRLVK